MDNRRDLLNDIYPDLIKVANKIMRGRAESGDLLNETVIEILESKSPRIPQVNPDFKHYCIRSLKLNSTQSCSRYNKVLGRWTQSRTDLLDSYNPKIETWMGARVDNELLDCALNFLPDLERKVFLLYIFDDFSYKSLSDQSGIPRQEIYDIVNNAKRQVRRIIGIE